MLGGLLYTIIGFIEVLIGLRFVFRLIGANPANPFVNWIYDWSTPFVSPFAGMLGQNATVAGPGVVTTAVFDWTALIAMLIFGVIGALVIGTLGRFGAHRV
jgi:YggT family protein